MNIIKPKKLKCGDTIAFVAPSGPVNKELVKKAELYFRKRGYNVKLEKNIFNEYMYLAGRDNERLEDLYSAFEDNYVDAILCIRGGYGTIRLAKQIDYDIIANHPKIFCGYSDITALNALLYKKCGLISFSGPMAQSDFSNERIDKYTETKFFETLTECSNEIQPIQEKIYNKGNCSGTFIGGNLATFVSLCGLDFIPDEKFIFFAEDLNEEAYKVDRYFTQLLNIEKFKANLSGIILGDFIGANNEDIDTYFENLGQELNIPISAGFPISHSETKATIPYGAFANFENNKIKFSDFMV